MVKPLQLTDEEAEFLNDVLDFWAGEMDLATKETIETAPCSSPEELLILVSGMEEQQQMTDSIRRKVSESMGFDVATG